MENNEQETAGCLMLVAAPCIFYITYLGWPPSGILIVTGLLWYCARKETNAGERAIAVGTGKYRIGFGNSNPNVLQFCAPERDVAKTPDNTAFNALDG